jgi:hypothetical protein
VPAHAAGVGHRAEQVEHERDADLAPRRAGVAERRVEPRREAEADSHLVEAARHAAGAELDGDAQLLEHVSGSALRRRPAVAVLAHRHTRAGDHERGHRRDVHRVRAISTRAHDVDRGGPELVAERNELGRAQDRVEQSGELLSGLALGPQGHGEGDDLCRRRVAGKDHAHGRRSFARSEVLAVHQP